MKLNTCPNLVKSIVEGFIECKDLFPKLKLTNINTQQLPTTSHGKNKFKGGQAFFLKVIIAPFERGNICKSKHNIFQNAHSLWMKSDAK